MYTVCTWTIQGNMVYIFAVQFTLLDTNAFRYQHLLETQSIVQGLLLQHISSELINKVVPLEVSIFQKSAAKTKVLKNFWLTKIKKRPLYTLSLPPRFELLSWLLQRFGHINYKNKDAKSVSIRKVRSIPQHL